MSADAPESPIINPDALEPLFAPWEEPNKHRVRAEGGLPPEVNNWRRPSANRLVTPLRAMVREWRESGYPGASGTTRALLRHWFDSPHRAREEEFRYYFCQREAVETLIWLLEVRRLRCLSALISEFGGPEAEEEALGVNPEEDEWARYAFKLATGAGKTKCMSLAIVWSYFHALRESRSEMARHFVVIAPNLTVFERLREDFRPEGGGPDIFQQDPLIPSAWRGDWNFSVVLQEEAGGAAAGGALYLTNIHRLFEKKKGKKDAATHPWAGPPVAKAGALDAAAALRERIASHGRVMLLNDEAHHVWDRGSAWNEAIRVLHEGLRHRGGAGLVAQLDFSATPKDDRGQPFRHIVCDTPLGEAVDAGIVKTPVIGSAGNLVEQPNDDAARRYEAHLLLGYERWRGSCAEWSGSGKRPLLFVMCENTDAADQIARRLDNDPMFGELNGKTINLHTNLKGRIRKKDGVFVESAKEISDADLKAIRRISRELDSAENRYACIVSVLMLREGWDVRNVTTIVPLRAYSAQSNILAEQTLGRGLRRMTPPGGPDGGVNEVVTVVEHEAFARLYREELDQEGLAISEVEVGKVPATTVSIFPDERKDWDALDIALPALTAAHGRRPTLEEGSLSFEEVREVLRRQGHGPLPLGEKGAGEIDYEGEALFTGEVVERMKIHQPLLRDGFTAISYYVRELEAACGVRNAHAALAPLIEAFLGETLFGERVGLDDPRLVARLADEDVRARIRAAFVGLIRERTTWTQERRAEGAPMRLRDWKSYQATRSERRPAVAAQKTLFNLVPCHQNLEVAMARFLDGAPDVAAFAKNAGRQKLRIDYLAAEGRLASYTPDFFVRTADGHYLLEAKGRQEEEAPRKAQAAVAWCENASSGGGVRRWRYVFAPQNVVERLAGNRFADLARACAPALDNLLSAATEAPELPFYETREEGDAEGFFGAAAFGKLAGDDRQAAREALGLYRFLAPKRGEPSFAPAFIPLLHPLDAAAQALVLGLLEGATPGGRQEREAWFFPDMGGVEGREHYERMAKNLRRGLLYANPLSVLGLLRSCLDYAVEETPRLGGVFAAVREAFRRPGVRRVRECVREVNDFRNTRVAHQEQPLTDGALAGRHLKKWAETLALLRTWREGDADGL